MYYLLLSRYTEHCEGLGEYKIVQEIIPEIISEFPDTPITERYTKDFLANCVKSSVKIPLGAGILVNS